MSEADLLLATTNRSKAQEIRKFLSSLSLEIFHLGDIRIEKPYPENKPTFIENARGKSLYYSQFWSGLTLAEDSGLEIDHLKGAPGIFSARFSGSHATDERNIQKVLKLMEGVPLEKRKARFVCALVLSKKGKVLKEITEHVEGLITFRKKGRYGFGYDPIFYHSPSGKTFAQLRPEEKNRVSHRGRALKKLEEFLISYLKK